MTKAEIRNAVAVARDNTKDALKTMYDALNRGQQKKIVKDDKVKALFDLYDVADEEVEE